MGMIRSWVLGGLTLFNRHASGVRAHAVGVGVKQRNAIPRIEGVGQRRDAHSQPRGRREKNLYRDREGAAPSRFTMPLPYGRGTATEFRSPKLCASAGNLLLSRNLQTVSDPRYDLCVLIGESLVTLVR